MFKDIEISLQNLVSENSHFRKDVSNFLRASFFLLSLHIGYRCIGREQLYEISGKSIDK